MRTGNLPPREHGLIDVLMAHKGEVVPYADLAAALWPARCPDEGPRRMAHHVLTYINRYRPDLRRRITAERGVGLRIMAS